MKHLKAGQPKFEDRGLVKVKMLRAMMTLTQFDQLGKLAEDLKVTRSEVVRRLIDKAVEDSSILTK